MIRVYGLKSCDTCKKALKALTAAGVEVESIDIRDDGVPSEVLAAWLAEKGPEVMVNRRSTTWRGLSSAEQDEAMKPDGAAGLIAANPTLMKRPVIEADGVTHVGWSKAVEAAVTGT
ncbi:MAG: Spx/MgsR family RNA polymerase-binding regulatory protein [Pseudomonadota bacterium]